MAERRFDVALFGATGYTGRDVARHLVARAPPGARLALAGRDRAKLEAVASALPGPRPELLFADAADLAGVAALAGAARVVCTTVGPYQRYGLPLVEACARAGTHYCDLTGEVLFMRETIDRFDGLARAAGARIVHACGFDCIPSDLGMVALHQHLAAQLGSPALAEAVLVVQSMRGGFSGGTLASFFATLEALEQDPSRARVAADPYALSPDRQKEPDLGDERDAARLTKDPLAGGWVAPFVMAHVNTRVVRRSNALLGHTWGPRLRYREVVRLKPKPRALIAGAGLTLALLGATRLLKFRPARELAQRLSPQPGEGPPREALERGGFRMRLLGRTEDGRRAAVRIAGEGDPGYAATVRMLGEAALALAFDGGALPPGAGVLTPATAFGAALFARLRSQRVTFDVEP